MTKLFWNVAPWSPISELTLSITRIDSTRLVIGLDHEHVGPSLGRGRLTGGRRACAGGDRQGGGHAQRGEDRDEKAPVKRSHAFQRGPHAAAGAQSHSNGGYRVTIQFSYALALASQRRLIRTMLNMPSGYLFVNRIVKKAKNTKILPR